MDYGELLTKAWRYLWRYKILWLFGILNGCQTFNLDLSDKSGETQVGTALVERWISDEPIAWIAIGIFVFSMLLLVLVSSIVGRIGLIRTTTLAERGEEKIRLETIFADEWGSFWRLLAFSFLTSFIAIVAFLIVFGVPFLSLMILIIQEAGETPGEDLEMALGGAMVIALLFGLCITLPVAFLINPFLQMSRIALVNEKVGIWSAIRNGWRIYRKNFGSLILLAIILLILRFLLGVALVPIAILLSFAASLWFVLLLTLFSFLPFGWVSAFTESVWTLAYLHLKHKGVQIGETAGMATG